MKYIECCEYYKNNIIHNFSPAKKIDNFFTEKEIEILRLYQFQNARTVKFQASSSNIQPLASIPMLFRNEKWLRQKFLEIFGDFSGNHSGNYFISNQPHDAHLDLITEEEGAPEDPYFDDVIPFKSVIIPLFLTKGAQAHTAFMHQRRIGYSVILDRDAEKSQDTAMYEISRNYNNFIDINGEPMDPEKDYGEWDPNKYPHISENSFRGLSHETILEQDVGSILVFDACQVHASIVIDKEPWLKNAINVQFYKSYNED